MYKYNDVLFFHDEQIAIDLRLNRKFSIETISDLIKEKTENFTLKRIKDNYIKRFGKELIDLNKSLPINGGISLTNVCQLRCNYCAYSSGETEKCNCSFKQVEHFVNFLFRNALLSKCSKSEEIVRIHFTGGGEPTIEWDLLLRCVQLIRRLSAKFDIPAEIGLTTNGVLTEKRAKMLIEQFDSVLVSFDGLPNIQNQNRKKQNNSGSFDQVHKTLKILNESNIKFNIRSTVWPEDYKYLIDMSKFVFDNYPNVNVWEIGPITPTGRAIKTMQHGMTSEIIDDNFVTSYIDLKNSASNTSMAPKIRCSLFSNSHGQQFCGTTFGMHPWLDSNGKILTCLDAKTNAPIIGYVNENGISIIEATDTIFENHQSSKNNKCSSCIAAWFCGGGCPLKSIETSGYKDIECDMKIQYWSYIIENISKGIDVLEWKAKKVIFSKYPEIIAYKMEHKLGV